MGGASASLAFALSGSKSKTKPDATTRALNEFRLQQAQSLTSSFGTAINRIRRLAYPDPEALSISRLLAKQSRQPGLDSDTWFNQASSNISGIYDSNLDYIDNVISPSLISAGNSFYNQILRPEIANNSALLGLARSGAQVEAQAKGAASIALPIAQTITGLQGQQLQGKGQGITAINQQRPDVDIALRNNQIQRLGVGLNAADYKRKERLGAEETYSNLLTSFINATPYQAGSTTKTNSWAVQGQVSGSYAGSGGSGNSSFFG